MAFTSWDDLISDLKDALEEHITSGIALIGEAQFGDNVIKYNSMDDVMRIIKQAQAMKALEEGGNPLTRRSYGRYAKR